MDVASNEFAEHGYQKASYNSIIEKCNLSKGVMYYYFDDKRDLFNTILTDANDSYLAYIGDWQTCSSSKEFWRQVKSLFNQSMQFFQEDPRAGRLVSMSMKSPDVLTETYKQLEQSSTNWFIDVLEEGQSLKAIRDDIPMDYLLHLVFALGQASDQWMLSRWQTDDESQMMEDFETTYKVIKSFLSPVRS